MVLMNTLRAMSCIHNPLSHFEWRIGFSTMGRAMVDAKVATAAKCGRLTGSLTLESVLTIAPKID